MGGVVAVRWPILGALVSGFDAIRRQPVLLLSWTLMWFAIDGAIATTDYLLLGPTELFRSAVDNNAPLSVLAGPWLKEMAVTPIAALLLAIAMNANMRAVLEPRSGERTYLRFGAAELRAAGLLFLFFVFLDLVTVILGKMASSGPSASLLNSELGVGAYIAVEVAPLLLFLLAFTVSLSWAWLVPADSLLSGRFGFGGAWAAGSGRRTRLYFTFVLAFLLGALVSLLGDLLRDSILSHGSMSVGQAISAEFKTSYTRPAPFHTSYWIGLALTSPFEALSYAVLFCPAAFIRLQSEPDYESVF